jgi:hypothetical protein
MKNPNRLLLTMALAMLMLATRSHHFATSLHLPDASPAVFFLAGAYLRGKWVFLLLLGGAVLIDYVAIAHFGVSDFCVSPAYVFLVPAYAASWAAGLWLRGHSTWRWDSLPSLAGAWLTGTGLAFLISNGSFYWLSGRIAGANWSQYLEQVADYFWPYLFGPSVYVGLALVLHGWFRALGHPRQTAGHEAGQ